MEVSTSCKATGTKESEKEEVLRVNLGKAGGEDGGRRNPPGEERERTQLMTKKTWRDFLLNSNKTPNVRFDLFFFFWFITFGFPVKLLGLRLKTPVRFLEMLTAVFEFPVYEISQMNPVRV